MLYMIEKFPQDFFSLKKESSRHKHTIIYLHRICILFSKRKMNSFTFWHLLGSKASFKSDYIFFFSYVSLAFWFYVLFEEAIEMDIWYVHKYIILKLIFFLRQTLKTFSLLSDQTLWYLLFSLSSSLCGNHSDHNGDSHESSPNTERMCLPRIYPDLHMFCWILWSHDDSPWW